MGSFLISQFIINIQFSQINLFGRLHNVIHTFSVLTRQILSFLAQVMILAQVLANSFIFRCMMKDEISVSRICNTSVVMWSFIFL